MIIDKVILKLKIEFNFIKKKFSKKIVDNEIINKMYIKKFLPACPVIIDAGAHIGADSVEMYRLYKNAQIHAFEPVPAIFTSLKHNVRKYKNIHTWQIALSNMTGRQELNISSGASDASSSLLKPNLHLIDHPDVLFSEVILVEATTLDDWAKKNNIDKVDFLWLDMQGFELNVLKTSKIIFPTVKVVHMEINTKATYLKAPLYSEVKLWMEGKGFRVDKEAIPKGWGQGNVLFIKS
jgi:FkbM family methyltransferase